MGSKAKAKSDALLIDELSNSFLTSVTYRTSYREY